jgi:triphosphoribosyl-dephospho-CoA synthase
VAAVAQLACLLEASAPKPGNVSPGRPFADLSYADFVAAAVAIAEPLGGAGTRPLGTTIRLAVERTQAWTATNVNLGIVLLLSPLARAAVTAPGSASDAALRARLVGVLGETTVDDAREAYAAIRLAAPGGLGAVESQDVVDEPTVTLAEAMRLAADRDTVAREYVTGFATTFEHAVPVLDRARWDGLSWDDAIVETFLTVLAAVPDSHVARRGGVALAHEVTGCARTVVDEGGVRTAPGRRAIAALDTTLRDPAHQASPGTTADLTAAALFVVLLRGGFHAGTR